MKKAAVVLTAAIVIVLGLLLLGNSSGGADSTSGSVSTGAVSSPPRQRADDAESAAEQGSELMSDEFNRLSPQEQDEMLEEFVLDFWESELGLSEADAEPEGLNLAIFNRPYMLTLTEREFAQLSPQDQEKALAEITDNCREVRSYVMDVKAEAEKCMNNKDYKNAEAYYVHCLQSGRELSVDKGGLIITRLVGIACEKAGLNGLVTLYEKTGENSNLQLAREQLSQIEQEVEEIKRTAKENEAQS